MTTANDSEEVGLRPERCLYRNEECKLFFTPVDSGRCIACMLEEVAVILASINSQLSSIDKNLLKLFEQQLALYYIK